MRCFPHMLISNVYKSVIVMNSLDTRFSRNVFEAVQKTRSTCFIGSKTTRLRLVVFNPITLLLVFKTLRKSRLDFPPRRVEMRVGETGKKIFFFNKLEIQRVEVGSQRPLH